MAKHDRSLTNADNSEGTIVYDGQNVRHVGIVKVVPQSNQQSGIFAVQCAVFAYGNVDENQTAQATVTALLGTEIAYVTGAATLISSTPPLWYTRSFLPTIMPSGFNVLFRATGAAGSATAENSAEVNVPCVGTFSPNPTSIKNVKPKEAIPDNTITTVLGAQL